METSEIPDYDVLYQRSRSGKQGVLGSTKGQASGEKKDVKVCIVGIDFGTTYSSFAYSFENEFKKSSQESFNKVICKRWNSTRHTSNKTPTCLLLDKDGQFVAFGSKAEEEYAQLANEKKHVGYRFFKHFKMMLHNNEELKRTTKLKDDQGAEMKAIDVFAHAIGYLMELAFEELELRGNIVIKEDIWWVLTIPAIWHPKSKQFMREAAEQAGINGRQLQFALEPEAASVWVKEVQIQKKEFENNEHAIVPFETGSKYLVLDLGGGTVDISVRQVNEDRTLTDLHVAAGSEYGGNSVNKEIRDFVANLIGIDIMDLFYNDDECKSSVLDLEMAIERMKCTLKKDRQGMVRLALPAALIEYFEEKYENTLLAEHIKSKSRSYKDPILLKREKLFIHWNIVAKFFQPTVKNILQILSDILMKSCTQGVKDIIMVGGFASCVIITKSVIEAYKGKIRVVTPPDPDLAVLKGAVLYRHWPGIVASRLCPFTYGSKNFRYFQEGYDDPGKKYKEGNVTYARDVFDTFAKIGSSFKSGETAYTDVYALAADMTKMSVSIYKSTEEDPRYCTDESCTFLDKLTVDMPDTTGGTERYVRVSFTLGDTEITVSAKQYPNGEETTLKLDML